MNYCIGTFEIRCKYFLVRCKGTFLDFSDLETTTCPLVTVSTSYGPKYFGCVFVPGSFLSLPILQTKILSDFSIWDLRATVHWITKVVLRFTIIYKGAEAIVLVGTLEYIIVTFH